MDYHKFNPDIFKKAKEYLNKEKINEVVDKLKNEKDEQLENFNLKENIDLLFEYFKSDKVPFKKKVVIMVMVLYILSPVDLMPGPVDDFFVGVFLFKKLKTELNNFKNGVFDAEIVENVDKEPVTSLSENPLRDLSDINIDKKENPFL